MVWPSIFANWNILRTQRCCHYCRLHCRKSRVVYLGLSLYDPYFSGLGPSKRNLTCLQCKFYIIRHQLVLFYFSFWFLHMKHIRHSLSCSKTFQIFKCLCLSSAVLPHLPSTLQHTGLLKILQVCNKNVIPKIKKNGWQWCCWHHRCLISDVCYRIIMLVTFFVILVIFSMY